LLGQSSSNACVRPSPTHSQSARTPPSCAVAEDNTSHGSDLFARVRSFVGSIGCSMPSVVVNFHAREQRIPKQAVGQRQLREPRGGCLILGSRIPCVASVIPYRQMPPFLQSCREGVSFPYPLWSRQRR